MEQANITGGLKRLLSTKEAATYCGITHNTFDTFAEKQLHINPIRIGKRKLFDLRAIDLALDRIQNFPKEGDYRWDQLECNTSPKRR